MRSAPGEPDRRRLQRSSGHRARCLTVLPGSDSSCTGIRWARGAIRCGSTGASSRLYRRVSSVDGSATSTTQRSWHVCPRGAS
jgi:hypothetical protein